MKVLSIVNSKEWSWGITSQPMLSKIPNINLTIKGKNEDYNDDDYDIVLIQNIDGLRKFHKDHDCSKMVVRVGGIMCENEFLFGHPTQQKENSFGKIIDKVGHVITTNVQTYALTRQYTEKVTIIPNPVNTEIFKPNENKVANKKFTVGFAGNISGDNNMYFKGWKIITDAYYSMIDKINFTSRIYELSQVSHREMVSDFYNKIDCLVLPSLNEGCSNTIGEALSCGVPVILTEVGYHGEMLINKCDCLFVKRDYNDLVSKIEMLINDGDLVKNISTNARKFAIKNQNIDLIVSKYNDVFNMILRRNTNE